MKPGKKTKTPKRRGLTPSLSACLMVRNEESNLLRCLTSIKDIVDEIVVVDTGSTDKTVEIAESFGAKVYYHPWEDNFSKHRNQSINYASNEWAFVIDADEELVFDKDLPYIKSQLTKAVFSEYPAAAILVKDIQKGNVVMQFSSARLFKKGEVEYHGIVHNQPTVNGSAVFFPYMHIRHYGYDLIPEEKKKKFTRTVSLLNRRFREDPTDYNCLFYLCQMYADSKDHQKCLHYGEEYMKHRDKLVGGGNFNKSVYFTVIHNYMKVGDKLKSREWLDAGRKDIPEDLDLLLASTEYGVWTNNTEYVTSSAKGFIEAYNAFRNNPSARGNRFIYSERPEALAYCVFYLCVTQLKEGSKTLQLLGRVLKETPKEFKDGILKELQVELKGANLPIHLQQSPSVTRPINQGVKPLVDSPEVLSGKGTSVFEASMNSIMGC